MNGRRYPVEPLERLTGLSHRQLRLLAGMDGSIAYKQREVGLTEATAERLAIASGRIAYEVWPEMLDHRIRDVARACANTNCAVSFVPIPASRRYCSVACRRATARRRYYHNNRRARRRMLSRQRAYDRAARAAALRRRVPKVCATEGCDRPVPVDNAARLYCTETCGNRSRKRRYRQVKRERRYIEQVAA